MAEDDEDNMREVEVEASIPFRGFNVWFENSSELSIPAAVQAVSRFAEANELGELFVHHAHYVAIPLRARHSSPLSRVSGLRSSLGGTATTRKPNS